MKLLKLLKWLMDIKPRYTLSLDDKTYNEQNRTIEYRFKTFGEHTFPVFSHKDIMSKKQILFSIHPLDLIDITLIEKEQFEHKNSYRIAECLRKNSYKIKNSYSEKILTGKEICETPDLLEQINSLDVYKIAYNTGFLDGRRLSQQLISELESKLVEPIKINKLQLVHSRSDLKINK